MLHLVWMFIVGIVIGFIARLFSKPPEGTPIHPAGILMSIVGAVLVLFVWNRVVG